MLKRAGAKGGIAKRVHPHGLRHSYASGLVGDRVPVNVISKALGHSSLAITSRYLDHIAPADAIALGRSRTWTADFGWTSSS
jgi:integrase